MIVTDKFKLDYPNLYLPETWDNIEGIQTPVDLKTIPEKSFLVDDELSNDFEKFCSDVYFKFLPFKKEEYSKISYRTLKFVTDKSLAYMDQKNYDENSEQSGKDLIDAIKKAEKDGDDSWFKKHDRFIPEGKAFSEIDLDGEDVKPHMSFIYYFNPVEIVGAVLEIRNNGGEIERIKNFPERLVLFDPKIRHCMTNTDKSQQIKIVYSNIWKK